jgi:hypothetical protein
MANQFFRNDCADGDIHQDVIGYAMKMRGIHTLQGEQRPAELVLMGGAARSCQCDGNSFHGSMARSGRLKYGKTHGERYRKHQTMPERGLAVYMGLWAGCEYVLREGRLRPVFVCAKSCSRHLNTRLPGGDLKPLGRFVD